MPSTAHLFPAVVPTVPTKGRRTQVDAALARVAKGAGRKPTSAHPFAECFSGTGTHQHWTNGDTTYGVSTHGNSYQRNHLKLDTVDCVEHIARTTGRRSLATA